MDKTPYHNNHCPEGNSFEIFDIAREFEPALRKYAWKKELKIESILFHPEIAYIMFTNAYLLRYSIKPSGLESDMISSSRVWRQTYQSKSEEFSTGSNLNLTAIITQSM